MNVLCLYMGYKLQQPLYMGVFLTYNAYKENFLMEKVKIDFKERELVEIKEYGVFVKPFLSNTDQAVLIARYFDKLFSENNSEELNHFKAENELIITVLELNTNIELADQDDTTSYVTMDDIFSHWDLWEKVEKAIVNYGNFKLRLLKAVEIERENRRLRAGLGQVIDNLYERATAYLDSLLDREFSDEQIDGAKELLKQANESPILKTIVEKLN